MPRKNSPTAGAHPRAATLNAIAGHERAIAYLRHALQRNRLPHAILIDGPRGVGKSALAYAVAKRILAGVEESDPAFEAHARKIAQPADKPILHPDIRVLEPAGAGGQIRVDAARDAIDWAYQTPRESPRKVILIDPADRLNAASANSMLKLIEEPPYYVVILLVAESIHSVLPTIRSRASRLRLLPLAESRVAQWLRDTFQVSEEEARAAALFSGGSPGAAAALLSGQAVKERDAFIAEWRLFRENGLRAMFRASSGLAAIGQGSDQLLSAWIVWLRDVAAAAIVPGNEAILFNRDRADDVAKEAQALGARAAGRCLETLIAARRDSLRLINRQLFVENLLIQLGPIVKSRA